MDVKKCTVSNTIIYNDNDKKDRNICKNCFSINRKKYDNNTFSEKDNIKKKVVNFVNNRKQKLLMPAG